MITVLLGLGLFAGALVLGAWGLGGCELEADTPERQKNVEDKLLDRRELDAVKRMVEERDELIERQFWTEWHEEYR